MAVHQATHKVVRNAATLLAAFYLVFPSSSQAEAPATVPTRAGPPAVPPSTSAATGILIPAPAQHISIGDKPAILYDGLSTKSTKLFILSRFQPLEILVKLDKWTKVRDAEGAIGWVENSMLSDRRFVQVSANTAEIRGAALPTSALIFEAQRGVLLEVTGSVIDGWLPVRHRDGQGGFVRSAQVWGG
ncbi:MAG: SH3 domain-containing protein [Betaproteobacteria bacterium]